MMLGNNPQNEEKNVKNKKFNKPVVGLFAGLLFPVFWFFLYYLYKTKAAKSFAEYIDELILFELFSPILTLCVLPNLLIYFLFKKLNYWYSIKGVIFSIFIYLVIVVIIRFS